MDYDAIISDAATALAVTAHEHQFGNATDADLEAAWGRLLALRWQGIESAPHDEVVLLHWQDWSGLDYMEATRFSTGERLPSGYSNRSEHGYATSWQPLPPAPVAGKGGV